MSSDPTDVGAAGVQQGDVLAGKYRVDRVLGVGGMGVVVAAHHLDLDERVAIKFLLPDAMKNPVAVARFDREARAAVKIKSEHVARVVDVGKLDNGAPYIVMEYLDGRDLAASLAEHGPFPVDQVVEFVLQACEAIAEAHALGIVHRDLKPANLYCIRRPDGALSIKVLDFGISKATGLGGAMGMTQTQTVIGSPLYMSPEQLESTKGVDVRTDIWALGVILFELIAGRVPFMGEGIAELVLRIMTSPTPAIEGLTGVPAGLDAVIQRCLAKDREARYANVSELANELIAFGPPRARLSVERIAGVMSAAGIVARPVSPSSPPGAQVTHPLRAGPAPITGTTGSSPMAETRVEPLAAPAAPRQAMTDGAWGQTGGAPTTGAGGGSRVALLVGGALLLVLASTGVGVLLARSTPTGTTSTAAPPSAAQTASPGATTLAPTLAPPPAAVASSSAPAPVASPLSAPAADEAGTASSARPASTTARPVTPSKAARPSCDPPYFLDSERHRKYKPECL